MPAPEVSFLRQKAVLWNVTGYDTYGQPTVTGSPIEINTRWLINRREVMDAKGNTITLEGTAVVDRKVDDGSIMWFGTLKDWLNIGNFAANNELMQVWQYKETPDVKGRVSRRTVELMKFKNVLPATTV